MTWPGGKNGAGVYQRIINHMPPHKTYIEGFCGSGAILRKKRPAARNIAIDASQTAIDLCQNLAGDRSDVEYLKGNTLQMLSSPILKCLADERTLAYFDPPYVMGTRKGGKIYDHEMSDSDHIDLLIMIAELPCMIMISGYRNAFYDHGLKSWHRVDYMAQTRQGMVDEALWMNFEPPNYLHDYSYLRENYRERERIKRKKQRWQNKIANMNRLERLAIMEVLQNV